MRVLRAVLSSSLIASLMLSIPLPTQNADACGWGGPYYVGAAKDRDGALAEFAGGSVGLVSPSWKTTYLISSYRWLQGTPIDADEQVALLRVWSPNSGMHRDAARAWNQARNAAVAVDIAAPQSHRQGSGHSYYFNCTDDAFATASATLANRAQVFANAPEHYQEWVRGQDAVFQNCGSGESLPTAVAKDAPLLLRKDRAYQIAAAKFYAGKFSEARAAFDAIGADKASPWQSIGSYLAVRSLVRDASVGAGDSASLLADAVLRLEGILGDVSLASMHGASRNLLDLVRYRLDPVDQLARLGNAIDRGATAGRLDLMAADLRLGLGELDASAVAAIRGRSALVDWLLAMRAGDLEGYARAHEGFAKHGTAAWLVAALSLAGPNRPGLGLLLTAAETIKSDSPAFLSVRFHQVRLLAASGKHQQASTLLADAFKTPMASATRNAYAALGLGLSTTLREWQSFALREEEGLTVLHGDARATIRESFSLGMMLRAAKMPGASSFVSREILMAGFVRAVVLGNAAMAKRMAVALQPLAPELAADLALFLRAKPAHRLGIGAMVILRHEYAFGEPSHRDAMSGYEQSCAPALFCDSSEPTLTSVVEIPGVSSSVGSSAEREAAQKYGTRLDGLGTRIHQFVKRAPRHALAPESLHLLVRATRRASLHANSSTRTGELSKASFKLLQHKYKDTEWAQKTRYWYR